MYVSTDDPTLSVGVTETDRRYVIEITVPGAYTANGKDIITTAALVVGNPPATSHTHERATAWSHNSTHHWHECIGAGQCPITENSGKMDYAPHSGDPSCTVCGYGKPAYNAPGSGEGYTINYAEENIAVKTGYEVNTKSDGTGTAVADGTAVTDGTAVAPGSTLYIRRKGDSEHTASDWVALAVPARPGAPSGPSVVDETIKGKKDGKITGLSTAMEYKAGSATGWTTCAGTEIPAEAGVAFQVRTKATSTAFASQVKTLTVAAGKGLTVTFNSQGGSTVASATGLDFNGKVTKPADPTRAGYGFDGWYTDADCTTAYDFTADVTADITLYAKWVSNSFSGTVTDSNGTAAIGATVKLMKGATQTAEATTDAQGKYSFSGVAPGQYNLVATYDKKTSTTLVTVDSGDGKWDIKMPADGVGSVLELTGKNTPAVLVGGLDAEAEAKTNGGPGKVIMTVESKKEAAAANAAAIKAAAKGKKLEYLEINIKKGTGGSTPALLETTNLLTIIIPFNTTGKKDVAVYRYHNGQVDTLPTTADSSGEYFEKGTDSITLHVKKFSTYAIGYEAEGAGSTDGPSGDSSSESFVITATAGVGGSISPSGGVRVIKNGSQTFTITPKEGFTVSHVLVDGVSVGAVERYTFEKVNKAHTISVLFKKIDGTPAGCGRGEDCPAYVFTDVDRSLWYHDGIHYCVENGLMVGTSISTFAPDVPASRGMLVTILWRLQGSPEVKHEMSYQDVGEKAYYAQAVRWADSIGLVAGVEESRFAPKDPITREQLAALLYRYEQKLGGGGFTGGQLAPLDFVDSDQVSTWAHEGVCWMTQEGILSGKENKILDPQGRATRGQAARMLMGYLEN